MRHTLTLLWLAVSATPLLADELPSGRPGQWETTMTINGQVVLQTNCITPEEARDFSAAFMNVPHCARQVSKQKDGSYVAHTSCAQGGVVSKIVHTFKGDFTREVIGTIASAVTVNGHGPNLTKAVFSSRWAKETCDKP